MGFSEYGSIYEVLYSEIPTAPAAPYFIDRSGDDFDGRTPFISIGWKPPVDTGGSVILGYKVYVQENTAAPLVLYDGSSDPTTLQFKFERLTKGYQYTFTVVARNQIGDSPQSSSILIYASTVPKKPASAPVVDSVTLGATTADIQISWAALASNLNGGMPVTGY